MDADRRDSRGAVYIIAFDPSLVPELGGTRFVLVLQNSEGAFFGETLTVCPVEHHSWKRPQTRGASGVTWASCPKSRCGRWTRRCRTKCYETLHILEKMRNKTCGHWTIGGPGCIIGADTGMVSQARTLPE